MTKEEAVRQLDAVDASDGESAHGDADKILLAYLAANGGGDIVAAYKGVIDRAGWWAYA